MDMSEESARTDGWKRPRDRRRRQRFRQRQVGRRPEFPAVVRAVAAEEHKGRVGRCGGARQPAQMPDGMSRRVQKVETAVAEEIDRFASAQDQR